MSNCNNCGSYIKKAIIPIMNQNDELMKRAEELASRPYIFEEYEETLPNGQTIIFVKNPELRGCMAQGATREEALRELEDARVSYIYSLLEDDLEVPAPNYTVTAGADVSYVSGQERESNSGIIWGSFEQVLDRVIQPDHRRLTARYFNA